MPEVENGPLQAFEIGYQCDECGEQMKRRGAADLDWGTYPHVCENGHRRDLPTSYPKIDWRPMGASVS